MTKYYCTTIRNIARQMIAEIFLKAKLNNITPKKYLKCIHYYNIQQKLLYPISKNHFGKSSMGYLIVLISNKSFAR